MHSQSGSQPAHRHGFAVAHTPPHIGGANYSNNATTSIGAYPVATAAAAHAELGHTLAGLFSSISRLSEERAILQAQYHSARQHRKEVQASLQGAAFEVGPIQTFNAPARPSALSLSSLSLPSATPNSYTPTTTMTTTTTTTDHRRGRASTTSSNSSVIEAHSARLRSASLERAKARAVAGSFPRTMLSGASPIPVAGVPVSMLPRSMSPDRIAIGLPGSNVGSLGGTPRSNSPQLIGSMVGDGGGSNFIGDMMMDPSLFQATQELFLQLQDPINGLRISDRRWRYKLFPSSFQASEAVDWMVEHKWSLDREDAVMMIQALVDQGVIVSVHTSTSSTSISSLPSASSSSSPLIHHPLDDTMIHKFEDTNDDGALYRLREPLLASGGGGTHQYSNAHTPLTGSSHNLHGMASNVSSSSQQMGSVKDGAAASMNGVPSNHHPLPASWHFTPLVTQCSIALLPSLARRIESHCASVDAALTSASASVGASNVTHPTPPPPLSTTQAMQQLRTNVLYLCTNQQTMWQRTSTQPSTNNNLDDDRVDSWSLLKTFPLPSASSSSSSSSPSTYSSLIQKSVGILKMSPAVFLADFLDLKLRKRLEPLMTSARIVTTLGENTRILHVLENMQPLGDKRIQPRELILFQDWFVDTTEQEAAAAAHAATPPQPTYILYECSIDHPTVTSVPGHRRGEVLLSARVIRPIPTPSGRVRTELTVISQLDFRFDTKEMSILQNLFGTRDSSGLGVPSSSSSMFESSSGSHLLPGWFLDKYLGLPSSISLKLPKPDSRMILAHSPAGEGGEETNMLHSDETGTIFDEHHHNNNQNTNTNTDPHTDENSHTNNMIVNIEEYSVAPKTTPTHDANASITAAAPATTSTPVTLASPPQASSPSVDVASTVSPPPPPPPPSSSSPSTPAPADPDHIPEFQPLAVLGRGAYSKILQVRDIETGTLYAMKVLRKVDVVSVGHESHVLTEQAILARLSHPFICRLFYAFQSQSKLYMVLSYAAGGDLWTLIRRQRISEHLAAFYSAELILALRYAHSHNVIHRDVKPENILIDHSGHIILADFGLSHECRQKKDQRSYSVSGTSEYLAPECILNKGHGTQMDWWQVGIIIHELLTGGKHPFYHKNLFRMQQNILHRQPHLSDHLSPDARDLILSLLHKDPLQRLGSCSTSKHDIETHPFFQRHASLGGWGDLQIDGRIWSRLESKDIKPEYRPKLHHPRDVSHFDTSYTSEAPFGGGGGGGNGGVEKGTPDSVFNSLAASAQSNSLSLSHLPPPGSTNFDRPFQQAIKDSDGNFVDEEAAAAMADEEGGEGHIEDDVEIQRLVLQQSTHHTNNQHQQQYSNPVLSTPFGSGITSDLSIATTELHPNAQHGSDPDQPFHSTLHSSAHTMLYNQSPMLSGQSGPAFGSGPANWPPTASLAGVGSASLHGSRVSSQPASPRMEYQNTPPMPLPPLPQSIEAHRSILTSEMLESESSMSLTSRMTDQDYFSGESRTGSHASSSSSAVPPSSLLLRSQSLPTSLPVHADANDRHGTHAGDAIGGNGGVIPAGSSIGSTTSLPASARLHTAPALHPMSSLPPPRLSQISGSPSGFGSASGSGTGSASGSHTPSSGGSGSSAGLSRVGSNEYYASSSNSLPNSFHPHHHAPHHQYGQSPSYGLHPSSPYTSLPYPPSSSVSHSTGIGMGMGMGVGMGMGIGVSHPPPSYSADDYDEIEAQYLEPDDCTPTPTTTHATPTNAHMNYPPYATHSHTMQHQPHQPPLRYAAQPGFHSNPPRAIPRAKQP